MTGKPMAIAGNVAETAGRRARPGARGFSLIELVMALAVLGIGIPPLINIGRQCLQNLHQGAYITSATSLAQEKIEHILADRACATRGYAYIVAGNYPAEASISGFPGYTRSVSIDVDSTLNGILFRNVKVIATAPDGTQATLSTWVIQ